MIVLLAMTVVFVFLVWLVFIRKKWVRFNIMWGLLCTFFFLHVLLIFVICLRFVTPYSTDAKVIQHTIQLVPRLTEPSLVTKVWVKPNVPVKKGDKLFEFDKRPYEYKLNAVNAQLAEAEQHVLELKASLEAAVGAVAQAKAQRAGFKSALDAAAATTVDIKAKRDLAKINFGIVDAVEKGNAGSLSKLRLEQARESLVEAEAAVNVALANEQQARVAFEETSEAAIRIAQANEEKARLAYSSQINGENTAVARLKAELKLAAYYLDNCVMVAPENGRIINLQVQEGMVSGIFRIGGIASFVVDADPYVLATYNQEHLKYVKDGQPVELALDLYPGQIVRGKVKAVWRGSGEGQLLPSGELPKFNPLPPDTPQGRFAVQIELDDPDQTKYPIGAQGTAAIYTSDGGWAALRKVEIRGRSWLNYLYPLNF